MDTSFSRTPTPRRTVLRSAGALVFASVLGIRTGSRAEADPIPNGLQSPSPTSAVPYYSYSPNNPVDSSPFPDLAVGGPSSSNSFTVGADTPSNANDGSLSTAWSAADQQGSAWWKVDLQGYFDLSGTRIVWPAPPATYAYRIEASVDDATWATVATKTADSTSARVSEDVFQTKGVRFLRVTFTSVTGAKAAGFCDFRAFGSVHPGSDVALAKSAWASTGYPPAHAVDGSATTSWDADGLYWRVDLQAKYDVSGIEVTWAQDNVAYQYTVEVSSDKATWTTAVDRSRNASRSQVQADSLTAAGVMFVRLRMIGVQAGRQAAFQELKVFGTFSPGTDVALNKTATASSGGSPGNANDGSERTLWLAADGQPAWWMVDLGAAYDLNTVRTTWESPSAAYQYTVEASADSTTWTRIVDRSSNTTTTQPFTDPVTATGVRYVRVNFLGAGGWWAALRECQVLGTPSGGAPGGGNVAQGKPSFTNDAAAYGNRGLGNDGSASTAFAFTSYGTPYVYRLDLRRSYDISAFEITWSGFGRSAPYEIQVSADSVTWASVVKRTATAVNTNPVTAKRIRFVKVLVPSTGDCYASGIRHLKVLATPSPAADLAAGRRILGKHDGTHRWWVVELAGLADIESVRIGWTNSRPGDHTVEVSSDNHTWVKGASLSGPGNGPTRLHVRNVRSVRIGVPASAGGPAVSDLQVMGTLALDETVLDLEAKGSFEYFWQFANTDTKHGTYGLISDTSDLAGPASSSATGFGLGALVIGAERGWVPLEQARQRALGTLTTLTSLQSVHGVLYHYYDRTTGEPWVWPPSEGGAKSEVGLIDTQLMLNGVIAAGEYFGGQVKTLADQLYHQVDWEAFRDPNTNQFHMSYLTDTQEFVYLWQWSAEQKIMYVLGAGSPTHPVDPSMFYAFTRHAGTYGDYPSLINTWFGSLFTYQFAENVVDFRNSVDGQGVDWWRNAVLATETNRQYATDQDQNFRTFGPNMWGMTASDSPTGYNSAFGAAPSGTDNGQQQNDGTLSPDGAAGSVAMDPANATAVLDNIYYNHPRAWGTYGFKNALNLDVEPAWYSDRWFALDKGIALYAIENHRSGLIWRLFMQNTDVINGLKRLQIQYAPSTTALETAITEARIALDRAGAARPAPRSAAVNQLTASISAAQAILIAGPTQQGIAGAVQQLAADVMALG